MNIKEKYEQKARISQWMFNTPEADAFVDELDKLLKKHDVEIEHARFLLSNRIITINKS